MTIAARNRIIRLATIVSLGLVAFASISLVLILLKGSLPSMQRPGIRPIPALDGFFLTAYSPVASALSTVFFPILSLACLAYVLFAFEKTQSIEITFFAACAFALSLESLRILFPLYGLWMHPGFFSVTISRVVLFCRIFTVLSLLASVIFTTGQTAQQIGSSVFLIAFFSFSLVNIVPFNPANLLSNFSVRPGYSGMLLFFMIAIGCLSVVSYAIQGATKGANGYVTASVGLFLFLGGYLVLGACDSWLFFAVGEAMICLGAWIYLKRMHGYYMWQ